MRKAILPAVLILTAVPLAGQDFLGFRAGVGAARMDFRNIHFAPCLPDEHCHGVPDDWIVSPLISADIGYDTAIEELSFRLSVTYAVKGGAASGSWANGTPSSGTQRLHLLQFSPLLNANMRAHPQDRWAVSLLAGPWAALPVACSEAGAVAWTCSQGTPEAGVAFGGGFQYTVGNNLTFTAESIYYWGLVPLDDGELTRLVAVQVGVTIHSRQEIRSSVKTEAARR